jgi:hypothetical protein
MCTRKQIAGRIPGLITLAAGLCGWTAPALAQQATEQLPNLKALPASDIYVARDFAGNPELRFAGSSWNAGTGPLELIAGEVVRDRQNVYQRIYSSDGSYRDRLAGSFVWHQGHNHFHFEDYALYTLQPTWTNSSRTATKTSFCVMDTDLIDGSLPGAPASPYYASCGNSYQGMSVGWGDTYGSRLAGQSISLTKLKDGDYRLFVQADPKNRLVESDETDNVACVLLRISVVAETVQVLNPSSCDSPSPPPVTVTVNGISPTQAAAGTSFQATILGSGFYDGVAVSFENGTSYKPVASNVVVVSPTEISATITIKKKGPSGSDAVWDLRVGNGVLANAFTVL